MMILIFPFFSPLKNGIQEPSLQLKPTSLTASRLSGKNLLRALTPLLTQCFYRYRDTGILIFRTWNLSPDRTVTNSLINSHHLGHIYRAPYDFITNGRSTYLTADNYLSGNIREKLQHAQLAAEKDPAAFSRNVSSLQNVLPKDIEPQDISIRINSPIVGEAHVEQFVKDLVNAYRVDVVHVPITGKWEIKCNSHSTMNHETYGTNRMSGLTFSTTS